MNEKKHQQLFRAARAVPPVPAPPGFADDVLRAIRQGVGFEAPPRGLADQLALLFPRLAAAALLVIAVGAAFAFYVDGDITTQLAQASDQWLLPMDWL